LEGEAIRGIQGELVRKEEGGQKGVRLAEEVWTRGRCRETVIAELFIVIPNLVGRQIDK
jgi:hypothetical protein